MSGTAPPPPPPPSSTTGEVIPPVPGMIPVPPVDPLEDQIQAIYVPLLQLPGKMVRPRFQEEGPAMPSLGTEWAALGVQNYRPDSSGVLQMEDPDPTTQERFARKRVHASFEVLISCYGAASRARLEQLKNMLLISQNRWGLRRLGMGITSVGDVQNVSYFTDQEKWLHKHDLLITMKRETVHRYRITSFLAAPIHLSSPSTP